MPVYGRALSTCYPIYDKLNLGLMSANFLRTSYTYNNNIIVSILHNEQWLTDTIDWQVPSYGYINNLDYQQHYYKPINVKQTATRIYILVLNCVI